MMSPEPTTTLSEFRADAAGQPFRFLVELYTIRHDAQGLATQIETLLSALPAGAERLYNAWNLRGQLGDAPGTDCAEMIDRVVDDARRLLSPKAGEEELLGAFRVVTLGLALTATLFPASRRRMEIRTARELAPDSSPGEEP